VEELDVSFAHGGGSDPYQRTAASTGTSGGSPVVPGACPRDLLC
jgi:hypothetical protein